MGGESRYPTSTEELGVEAVMALSERDPELLSLLQGSAPASLELQVLDGSLPDAAPTAQQRQDAATAARVEELLAANPYATGGSLTERFELEALAPEAAAKLQATATPQLAPMHEGDRLAYLRHGYAVPAQS